MDLLGGVVVCGGGGVAAGSGGGARARARARATGGEGRGRSRDTGRRYGTAIHGSLLGDGFVRRRRLLRSRRAPRAVRRCSRGVPGAKGGAERRESAAAGGQGGASVLSTGAPRLVDGATTTPQQLQFFVGFKYEAARPARRVFAVEDAIGAHSVARVDRQVDEHLAAIPSSSANDAESVRETGPHAAVQSAAWVVTSAASTRSSSPRLSKNSWRVGERLEARARRCMKPRPRTALRCTSPA